jgi:hypothetical protein
MLQPPDQAAAAERKEITPMLQSIIPMLQRMTDTERTQAVVLLKQVAEDIQSPLPDCDWRVVESFSAFANQSLGEGVYMSSRLARLCVAVATHVIARPIYRVVALEEVAAHTLSQHPGGPDEDAFHIYYEGIWREIFACLDREPGTSERQDTIASLLSLQDDPAIRAALEARMA